MNWQSLKCFLWLYQHGLKLGKCLTLGRQNLYMGLPEIRDITSQFGISSEQLDRYLDPVPEYSERFFEMLGATAVESMDASNYENATHVHDLNNPIPAQLAGQYDTVFDGGTLEHAFNFPQALRNAMDLLKVGGNLIVISPCNNMVGHGFYCIGPEVYYRALSEANGFQMKNLRVYERYPHSPWHEYPDPASAGDRVRLVSWGMEVEVIAHATKVAQTEVFAKWPQQSDYSSAWQQGALKSDTDWQHTRLGIKNTLGLRPILSPIMKKLRDRAVFSPILGKWGKRWLNSRTVSLRSQHHSMVRSDPLLDGVKPRL